MISVVPQRSFSSVGIFEKQRESNSIPVSSEVYSGSITAVGFSFDGDQLRTIEDVDGTVAYSWTGWILIFTVPTGDANGYCKFALSNGIIHPKLKLSAPFSFWYGT